jgi:hypothetical protein
VRLTDLVIDTRVVQDALSDGGLASINVSHDADVADLTQVGEHVKCHGVLRKFCGWGRNRASGDRAGVIEPR